MHRVELLCYVMKALCNSLLNDAGQISWSLVMEECPIKGSAAVRSSVNKTSSSFTTFPLTSYCSYYIDCAHSILVYWLSFAIILEQILN